MSNSVYELPKLSNDFEIKAFNKSLNSVADIAQLRAFLDRLILMPPEEDCALFTYKFLNIICQKYSKQADVNELIIELKDIFFRKIYYIEAFCKEIDMSSFYHTHPEVIELLIDILQDSRKEFSFREKVNAIKRISHNKKQRNRLNDIYEDYKMSFNV